ncbi:MAG: MBL fold metallo-hydrolase [Thermodesulfobacteriota bacterium]
MLIRCWGSRGSIPVSGEEYIKYGGDTTCVEITSASGEIMIIDAGTGIRALGNSLVRKKRSKMSLLLTHSHWDHLSGFPFFKPLYRKESKIKVWGPEVTHDSLRNLISNTMAPPYFPIELEGINADISFHTIKKKSFSIGGIKIENIPLSHTNQGVGYKFTEDGKSFVFITDNEITHQHPGGLDYRDYVKFSEGADLLFHDAEYTPADYKITRGWGHSVYLDTLYLALEAGVKKLGLFHHNQDRTDPEIDKMVEECRSIAYDRGSGLECLAVAAGTAIEL